MSKLFLCVIETQVITKKLKLNFLLCKPSPYYTNKTMLYMSTPNFVIRVDFLTCWLQAFTSYYSIIFLFLEYSQKNRGSIWSHTLNPQSMHFSITYCRKPNVNLTGIFSCCFEKMHYYKSFSSPSHTIKNRKKEKKSNKLQFSSLINKLGHIFFIYFLFGSILKHERKLLFWVLQTEVHN